MNSDTFITTPWAMRSGNLRTRVKYGMHKLDGNKQPYFSITCDTEERKKNNHWYEYSCGADHATITKHFPELAPLLKWHLTDQDGTPMHYVENAIFWYEIARGVREPGPYDKDPLGSFKACAVWGAVPADRCDLGLIEVADMRACLVHRLPFLQTAFKRDMDEAGVTFILPNRMAS